MNVRVEDIIAPSPILASIHMGLTIVYVDLGTILVVTKEHVSVHA